MEMMALIKESFPAMAVVMARTAGVLVVLVVVNGGGSSGSSGSDGSGGSGVSSGGSSGGGSGTGGWSGDDSRGIQGWQQSVKFSLRAQLNIKEIVNLNCYLRRPNILFTNWKTC